MSRVGEFCSRACYAHFLVAVTQQAGIIEMEEFLDLDMQPWHTQHDET